MGGGVYAIFAMLNWNFLSSSYAQECAGGALASGCGSLAGSAAVAALGLIVGVGVALCGAALHFMAIAGRRRAAHPQSR